MSITDDDDDVTDAVLGLVEDLTVSVLSSRPKDIARFCADHLDSMVDRRNQLLTDAGVDTELTTTTTTTTTATTTDDGDDVFDTEEAVHILQETSQSISEGSPRNNPRYKPPNNPLNNPLNLLLITLIIILVKKLIITLID